LVSGRERERESIHAYKQHHTYIGLGKIDPSYTILGISDYAADVKVKKKDEK
jgi:hypothetical protein